MLGFMEEMRMFFNLLHILAMLCIAFLWFSTAFGQMACFCCGFGCHFSGIHVDVDREQNFIYSSSAVFQVQLQTLRSYTTCIHQNQCIV